MKFYIDGVECPETNGIGIDAVGGLFNCGLTGTTFKVECTTFCSPGFAIVEIFLWKYTALTVDYEDRNYDIYDGFKSPGIETMIYSPHGSY